MVTLKSKCAVLLIDDSVDDRFFMRLALERGEDFKVIAEVSDGQEAIDYLKGEGPFHDRTLYPWPDLLVLDLKMPRKNGFDVLEWIQNEAVKVAAVIVSGASLQEDMAKSLALGALAYFKKPSIRQEQEEMMKALRALLNLQS